MPGNFTGGDYRRCSPFRKVDWRWRCATEHLLVGDRLSPWEDPAIEHALKFQRAWNADGGSARQTAARQRWPELAEAYRLHERGGPLIDEIQARLLAAEPPKVISHKTAVGADVIAAYEKFFFDVSEFLGAIDWLLCDAVGLYDKPITEGLVWRSPLPAGRCLLICSSLISWAAQSQSAMTAICWPSEPGSSYASCEPIPRLRSPPCSRRVVGCSAAIGALRRLAVRRKC
jgi:hypothetical protein